MYTLKKATFQNTLQTPVEIIYKDEHTEVETIAAQSTSARLDGRLLTLHFTLDGQQRSVDFTNVQTNTTLNAQGSPYVLALTSNNPGKRVRITDSGGGVVGNFPLNEG